MNGVWHKIGALGCAALLVGCVNSRNTRLPTLGWGDTKAEARSYNYHDPLAERETGPFVERPRGMERQRPEARRVIETYEQTVDPAGYKVTAPQAARYPDSVTP